MRILNRYSLIGLCITLAALAVVADAQQMPRTTKEQIPGAATTATEQLKGTVTYVEGNKLVVQMSTGELRTFDVPESRRFLVDGKDLTVHELKTGTKLTATVTTIRTPIIERTTTVGTGRVFFVSGNTVILTLPNNENRMYKVNDAYRFIVNGQKASVHDLRQGMVISAEKIVEEPKTEIASNTVVTGQAPSPPQRKLAEAPASTPAPTPAPAPTPIRPKPVPPPVATTATAPTPPRIAEKPEPPPPAQLPKTGSPVPLIGLAGLLCVCASSVLHTLRRRR